MSIKQPKIDISIIPAGGLAGVKEHMSLMVGQMLAAGTATAGALIQDIGNDGSEDTLFSARAHVAGLVRAFKRENPESQLDVLPLADAGASTAATSVLVVAGTATEDGTYFVSVASEKDYRVKIDVTSGDLHTDVATAIETAFALLTKAPFQGVDAAGTITFTAENKGTLANDWGIKVEGVVAGLTMTLTGWTGGATDPTLTSVLDVIANIRYQTVLWPSAYVLTVIEDELNSRFNTSNAIMDGVAVQAKADTLTNLKSYTAALNSQSLVIPGIKTMDLSDRKGSATLEMLDIAAAEICAIRALRLTTGAQLTDFLTTVASADQFGGPALASLPYFNTGLPNLPIANPADEFSDEDRDELADNALAAYGPNDAFNGTIFGEFVTTYLTDTAANPDTSYKFLNTVDTASIIREFFFVNLKNRYAQTRLTSGDLVPGRDMANEASIRVFMNRLYGELANDALVQKGQAAVADFNLNLAIALTLSSGTVTFSMAPLLVSQLRVIIGTIQINFGGN